jgi:hypothetical protein
VRCPSCRRTGEPFSRNYDRYPECQGSGALATVWLYLRAWWFVAGRVGGLLFLLVAAWFFCAIPATAALVPLLSVFGIGDNWDWLNAFCWLTGLFAFGSLVLVWCYVQGYTATGPEQRRRRQGPGSVLNRHPRRIKGRCETDCGHDDPANRDRQGDPPYIGAGSAIDGLLVGRSGSGP